ncbi:hypothetical protein BDM02DRAFT_3262853 [Thelephora ganbajun]|uniref:Uncharacterized protein n=1 Tax=Thelephora ganbajun TaxID=370292 RepID=A0ACB6Z8C2_THEGA|nr:hypothetical protein BDM02DRAFT_3262853 [Thelephora ganbajun]
MSSDTLKEIIDAGHDIVSLKYYEVAVATVLLYDYLLTLADEINFAWHGRKSWVFALFLVVHSSLQQCSSFLKGEYRIGTRRWDTSSGCLFRNIVQRSRNGCMTVISEPLKPLSLTHVRCRCEKYRFFSILAFVWSTLLAQVALTLRIYAITGKNRTITTCFGVITTSQFVFGLYLTGYAATEGTQQILPIPLDAYRICIFVRHRPPEFLFTAISLLYDLLAFSLTVYLAARSNIYKSPIPSLLRTIAQDATLYFLVIFTSHLVLELTLLFARPTIRVLPAAGNTVYLPVMVTRLMLSLKKANASQEHAWSLGAPTVHTAIAFAECRGFADTGDEIHLDTYASGHEGTQSQTWQCKGCH